MKFAFFYPVKIITAERNLTPEVFTGPLGLDVVQFANQNVYFSSDKQRIVVEKTEGVNIYFIRVGDYYSPIRHVDASFDMGAWLANNLQMVVEWVEARQRDLLDRVGYEQRAAVNIAKIRAEREEQNKKVEEERAARAARVEEAYQTQIAEFRTNLGRLSWDDFERLCRENNVNIPIKTKGWGRTSVRDISAKTYTLSGSNKSSSIFGVLDNLRAALNIS